jgi:hypothetical protein
LSTGLHRVRDIYCLVCFNVIGWTYVSLSSDLTFNKDMAYEDSERYKEGRSVVEKSFIKKKKYHSYYDDETSNH